MTLPLRFSLLLWYCTTGLTTFALLLLLLLCRLWQTHWVGSLSPRKGVKEMVIHSSLLSSPRRSSPLLLSPQYLLLLILTLSQKAKFSGKLMKWTYFLISLPYFRFFLSSWFSSSWSSSSSPFRCLSVVSFHSPFPCSSSQPFWAAAPKGRCPEEHKGEFQDVHPSVLLSVRPSVLQPSNMPSLA